jgi:hypothetical protein
MIRIRLMISLLISKYRRVTVSGAADDNVLGQEVIKSAFCLRRN